VDVALNWSVEGGGSEGGRRLINPSLLWVFGGPNRSRATLVRAARLHGTACSSQRGLWSGEEVTQLTTTWHSDIVLEASEAAGSAEAWRGWEVPSWGLSSLPPLRRVGLVASLSAARQAWAPLCQAAPRYVPANRTLLRSVVDGPEDPKLLALGPVARRRPSASPATTLATHPFALLFSSRPPTQHRPACERRSSNADAVPQMYLSGDGARLASTGRGVAVRLQCGEAHRPEKNWIAFTLSEETPQLHFVYSLFPHAVLLSRLGDGMCERLWSTASFPPLNRLAGEGSLRIHGSATAVRYSDDSFLALMHTLDDAGDYATLAYTFASAPPFRVTAVSRALPLPPTAFPSALSFPPTGLQDGSRAEKLLVGYGVSDAQSRLLVMSRGYLEQLFDWCGWDEPTDNPLPRASRPEAHLAQAAGAGGARAGGAADESAGPSPAEAAVIVSLPLWFALWCAAARRLAGGERRGAPRRLGAPSASEEVDAALEAEQLQPPSTPHRLRKGRRSGGGAARVGERARGSGTGNEEAEERAEDAEEGGMSRSGRGHQRFGPSSRRAGAAAAAGGEGRRPRTAKDSVKAQLVELD